MQIVDATMGQSKIDVFREILGHEDTAQHANDVFEERYAAAVAAGEVRALPGAAEAITVLCDAGIQVCLLTGFSPATRDAIIDTLGWRPLIDLALSPADAGRGRPWPDLPLTALLRLGGGAVSELAVVGDTASDIESGRRAGAGPGRRGADRPGQQAGSGGGEGPARPGHGRGPAPAAWPHGRRLRARPAAANRRPIRCSGRRPCRPRAALGRDEVTDLPVVER